MMKSLQRPLRHAKRMWGVDRVLRGALFPIIVAGMIWELGRTAFMSGRAIVQKFVDELDNLDDK
jgi:hypothetical protein